MHISNTHKKFALHNEVSFSLCKYILGTHNKMIFKSIVASHTKYILGTHYKMIFNIIVASHTKYILGTYYKMIFNSIGAIDTNNLLICLFFTAITHWYIKVFVVVIVLLIINISVCIKRY